MQKYYTSKTSYLVSMKIFHQKLCICFCSRDQRAVIISINVITYAVLLTVKCKQLSDVKLSSESEYAFKAYTGH